MHEWAPLNLQWMVLRIGGVDAGLLILYSLNMLSP